MQIHRYEVVDREAIPYLRKVPLVLATYHQITELPAQIVMTVPPEFIDENDHMNIGRYLELGGEGLWKRCQSDLGMPENYIAERGLSTFTAEHHIQYFAEVLEGEEVGVHVRLIGRSDKVLHMAALITNRTKEQFACLVEATIVHIDMSTRRPTPFPADVADLIDAGITSDDLGWPLPLSGSMGVRRRA